jgi:hypothetical protein
VGGHILDERSALRAVPIDPDVALVAQTREAIARVEVLIVTASSTGPEARQLDVVEDSAATTDPGAGLGLLAVETP